MCSSQFLFSILSTIIASTSVVSHAADAVDMKSMHEKHMQTLNKKNESVSSLGSPAEELNQLDTRTPVPMPPYMALHQKQNMREHLEAVQGIMAGLSKKDFKAIAAAAKRMGFSDEMGKMCQHMGAGAAGFTEQAIQFHKSADEIVRFAEKRDQQGVIAGLNNTLNKCTACHATYKQHIVDEATYKSFAELMKKSMFDTKKPK
jgi:hypothetical protein